MKNSIVEDNFNKIFKNYINKTIIKVDYIKTSDRGIELVQETININIVRMISIILMDKFEAF